MIKYIFLLLPMIGFSQEKILKKANAIEVNGVSFREIGNSLLDAGYTFDKLDSNFQTVKTEFKEGNGKNKWMRLRLFIRIKDSVAIITGEWYNSIVIGANLLGQIQTIENSTYKIEYTGSNTKKCFLEMKTFAESFKKPTTCFIK
jgi:hypothetical protein